MSTPSRLSVAFGLSFGLHAALVLALLAAPAPARKPPHGTGRGGPGLSISLCEWERPAPVRAVDPKDFISADILPSVGSAPATPLEGPSSSGAVGKAAPVPSGGPPGGGAGAGILAAPGTARRVVYLVDRSASMGLGGGLRRARQELREALGTLPPDAWFQVLFYNQGVQPLLPAGPAGLLRADPATAEQALARLDAFPASGGTAHLAALQAALSLRPEVLFLVTDADDLTQAQMQAITRLNGGRTRLHVVEMSRSRSGNATLAALAGGNGGSYRLVPPSE